MSLVLEMNKQIRFMQVPEGYRSLTAPRAQGKPCPERCHIVNDGCEPQSGCMQREHLCTSVQHALNHFLYNALSN